MTQKDEHENSCLVSNIQLNSHEKDLIILLENVITLYCNLDYNILKISFKFCYPYSLNCPRIQYLTCLVYSISWI